MIYIWYAGNMSGPDLADRTGSKYNDRRIPETTIDEQMNHSNGNGNSDYLLKLERLSSGEPPRIVDLFAGCGGMSLGFHRAGYSILGGIELDPKAAHTHARKLLPGKIRRRNCETR